MQARESPADKPYDGDLELVAIISTEPNEPTGYCYPACHEKNAKQLDYRAERLLAVFFLLSVSQL